ncbi:MAG: hypothetical protein MHM6MM_001711 [Cercozoa sp. M6MM]
MTVFNFQPEFGRVECHLTSVRHGTIYWATWIVLLFAVLLFVLAAYLRSLYQRKLRKPQRQHFASKEEAGAAAVNNNSDSSIDSDRGSIKTFKYRAVQSLIILVTIAYVQFLRVCILAVQCYTARVHYSVQDTEGDNDASEQKWLLNADNATECYRGASTLAMQLSAWAGIVLVGAVFPLMCLRVAWRSYVRGLHKSKRHEKYGFLWRDLRPDCFWFRQLGFPLSLLVVAASIASASANSPWSLAASLGAATFSLVVLLLTLPFATWWQNMTRVLMLIFSVIAQLYMAAHQTSKQGKRPLLLCVPLAAALAVSLVLLCRHFVAASPAKEGANETREIKTSNAAHPIEVELSTPVTAADDTTRTAGGLIDSSTSPSTTSS